MKKMIQESCLLTSPRKRHYAMSYIALRQISQQDPHYFFGALASKESQDYLTYIIEQVEKKYPNDPTKLLSESFDVALTKILNYPLILISMPPVKAYAECIYVGVVLMLDTSNVQNNDHPDIRFFTLELSKKNNEQCYFFAEWKGEQPINLAAVNQSCSIEEFTLLINHHMEVE